MFGRNTFFLSVSIEFVRFLPFLVDDIVFTISANHLALLRNTSDYRGFLKIPRRQKPLGKDFSHFFSQLSSNATTFLAT